MLPNIASPIIVRASIGMGFTILTAAALGFLGLGPPPPTPEWGRTIAESREFLPDAWWYAAAPGLAIFLTVMGFNLLGDGLRDVLDPRLRRSRTGAPMAELLSVRELRVDFVTDGGVAQVLDGINLDIGPGEVVGLVGESGCGKTTLARAILGILPAGRRAHPRRRGALQGRATSCARTPPWSTTRVRGRAITFIPQDPSTSFSPVFTVEHADHGPDEVEVAARGGTGGGALARRSARYPRERYRADREAVLEIAARGADPRAGARAAPAAPRVLGRASASG